MRRRIDLTGRRFGRWKVIRHSHKSKLRKHYWLCACECGEERAVVYGNLVNGASKSCGCLHLEIVKESGKTNATHGMYGTPTYQVWSSMKGRCLNQKDHAYVNYGGRGIKICERWLKFENFLADMGERPEGMSIDRENNDGDYELGNCRWATQKEQCRNTRRNKFVEYKGEKKTISEWAEQIGMSSTTLWKRLDRGWSVERALKPQHDVRRCI